MRRITLLSALMIGMVACEEIEQTEPAQADCPELPEDSGLEDSGLDEPEPFENPFAYVGEEHNHYLACTMEQRVESAEDVMAVLVKVCGYPDGPETRIASAIEEVEPSLHGTGIAQGLSADELEVLAEIDRIVRTYEPGEALLQLELEVEPLIVAKRIDKASPLLMAYATAQSSGEFWLDNEPQSKAKWWQIVLADAAGALVGGVVGGPAGGITLGVTASTLVAK